MRVILATLLLPWLGAEPSLLELSLRAREARLTGDLPGWLQHGQETLARAPDHPDLLISVSRALAANGRADEALELLGQAVRRGARVDAAALPEYASIRANPRFAALAEAGRQNMRPVAPPEVFLGLGGSAIDPEGITYDADTARLFVGSLAGGIWQVGLDKRVERFAGAESGLREVLGLKVDRKRRLLWAATGVFPDPFAAEPKKDAGLTGVLAFDLDDGRRVSECWLDERPVVHGFNDLALAANGDVYVSDSAANAVYRLPGGDCRPEKVVQDARMSFPNGIALSSDESRLYVAHIEGLSAVDLQSGRRTALAVPESAAVNSMDGLVPDGPDLVGIQPSPYLARVVRIRLNEDGLAVREAVTVSSPPPEGLSPTTGVIVASQFYSVATAPPGSGDAADRRPTILRSNLR